MATTTDKKVTRVTTGAYASRIIGTKARRIAVTIMSGDTLILRLYGTQQREYMSIKDAFERARTARVLAERASNPKLRSAFKGRRAK